MAARWSAQEHKTLESLLADGVELNLLKKHLPNRSHDALHRQAQKYGYGVNTVDGVKRLYDDIKTRVHQKKVEEEVAESRKKIIGETRTTTNSSTPTVIALEQTTKNFSDDIVADSACNINGEIFMHIYEDIKKLLNNEKYQHLKSITVSAEDTLLTVYSGNAGVKS